MSDWTMGHNTAITAYMSVIQNELNSTTPQSASKQVSLHTETINGEAEVHIPSSNILKYDIHGFIHAISLAV